MVNDYYFRVCSVSNCGQVFSSFNKENRRRVMNKVLCIFFGHKYFLAQKLNNESRRVCCKRCSKSFAINDNIQAVVPWGADFHEMYERHGIQIKYLDFEFSRR